MELTYTEEESKLKDQLKAFAPKVADSQLHELAELVIASANKEIYSLLAIKGRDVVVFELGLGHNFNEVKNEFSNAEEIVEIKPDRNKWFRLQACKVKMTRAHKKAAQLEVDINLASVKGMLTVHDDGTLPNQPNYWRRWLEKFRDAGNEVMYRYMVEALKINAEIDPNNK